MKKLIVAGLILGVLAPFAVQAQVDTSPCNIDLTQASDPQLRACLIVLMEELVVLEQQQLALQNTPIPAAPEPTAPVTIVTQPQVVIPPPAPVLTAAPQPSCTLSFDATWYPHPGLYDTVFSWTTQNIPDNALGTISVGNYDYTGTLIYRPIPVQVKSPFDAGNNVTPQGDVSYKLDIGGTSCEVQNNLRGVIPQ